MFTYIYIYIHTHIYIYIYTYIHRERERETYVFLEGFLIFALSSNDCSQRDPNVGLRLAFSWLILEIWSAVGSFHVFGKQVDLTRFYKSESSCLRKHRSPAYWLDGKFHHQQCGQRVFVVVVFQRKDFFLCVYIYIYIYIYIRRDAFICWRFPLWR